MADLEQLEKLSELKDKGVLSAEEFEAEKAKLLSGSEVLGPSLPKAAWERVALGLNLWYTGVALVFFTVSVGVVLVAVTAIPAAGLTTVLILEFLAITVGQVLMVTIPKESGAKPLAIAIAVFAVLGTLLNIVGTLGDLPSLVSSGQLAGLLLVLCVPFFVHFVATFLADKKLQKRVKAFGVVTFVSTVLVVLLVTSATFAGGVLGGLMAPIFVFIWFLLYLQLIRDLRDAIRVRMTD